MKLVKRLNKTYSVLLHFAGWFLAVSFFVRMALLLISINKAELSLLAIGRIFSTGLLFDVGVSAFILTPYSLYLLVWPSKWNNSVVNKSVTYFFFSITVLIVLFSFFAEFTFWQEFESRFNFIAVDYLIYTYEVISNINESYPLPILIGGMLLLTVIIIFIFTRRRYFAETFHGSATWRYKLIASLVVCGLAVFYGFLITNDMAETSKNRYQNELAKAGIYSFFSAFRNNELNYEHFYRLMEDKEALDIVKKQMLDHSTKFTPVPFSNEHLIVSEGIEQKPNVIMITIESFSADFMQHFGNNEHITPFLDSLADRSLLFTNMYATGTRTVRGMEALTLAVPPTPGSSIVRRPHNEHLSTIGHVFQQHGYETGFFYGGDGYFDNMNRFFGNNGYTIHDRGRNILVDPITSDRILIPDTNVHFENAWGICDEDLYDVVLEQADKSYAVKKPFYHFVMTTSNHRPYTFPSGKIDLPSASGRNGSVKYTDYAIRSFLQKAHQKAWFRNTVFIFVADHCASSAGKNEIDVSKYHIPAIVYNLPDTSLHRIDKVCSQIDLYPTLFHLLHWNYSSKLFGQDVTDINYHPRAFVGTYQKLAYLKNEMLVVLSPQQKVECLNYNFKKNTQTPAAINDTLVNEAIAYYQTASYLFKHSLLNQ